MGSKIPQKTTMSSLIADLLASKSSQSEMRDIAARICRDYLHGAWKTISAEEIQLKRISGGLSNFLYYVSLPEGHSTSCSSPTNTALAPRSPSRNKRPRKDDLYNGNNYYDSQGTNQYEPKEVLLRIYGQTHGEHALETMLTESVVFTLLSERKLGPKLHGIFPGGRIEQYIPARPLTTIELSDEKISTKIAEKMGEIHSLDIPVSKEPDWMWKTSQRWLISIQNVFNNNDISKTENDNEELGPKQRIINKIRAMDLSQEVQWLKDRVREEEQQFLVVFSHNDLQEGNILFKEPQFDSNNSSTFIDTSESVFSDFEESSNRLDSMLLSPDEDFPRFVNNRVSRKRNLSSNEEDSRDGGGGGRQIIEDLTEDTHDSVLSGQTLMSNPEIKEEEDSNNDPELMIIDFEYCSYNYRGFDFANHFLEWCFDYTNKEYPFFHFKKHQYPSPDQQKSFIETYMKKTQSIKRITLDFEKEYQAILKEVTFFTMASHLFWSLWAIVNCDQEIEFGYWEYASCRLDEYLLAKQAYLDTYKRV